MPDIVQRNAEQYHQIKSENSANDAIVDDTAGQAYVEQFGLETFTRADRAVQANKVTRSALYTYVSMSDADRTADKLQTPSKQLRLSSSW